MKKLFFSENINMISILVDDTKCNTYKKKQNMVVDEGNNLQTSYGFTEDECKTKCTDMNGCKSFRYCSADKKCFFKDKMISDSSPEQIQTQCYTVYQNCGEGNFDKSII